MNTDEKRDLIVAIAFPPALLGVVVAVVLGILHYPMVMSYLFFLFMWSGMSWIIWNKP